MTKEPPGDCYHGRIIVHGVEAGFGIHSGEQPGGANACASSKFEEMRTRLGGCENAQERTGEWIGSHAETSGFSGLQDVLKLFRAAKVPILVHEISIERMAGRFNTRLGGWAGENSAPAHDLNGYLCTRAPPPFMSFSTSSLDAIEVSP